MAIPGWRAPRRSGLGLAALLVAGVLAGPALAQTITLEPRCNPQIAVDVPSAGVTLRGELTLSGWALDLDAQRGSGVDAVHVYVDGEAGGTGRGVGVATLGTDRRDVDAAFGRQSTRPGWTLTGGLEGASIGGHALFVYAHTRCGWTYVTRVVNVAGPDGWALLNPPQPRNSHSAVWDPDRAQMLVFGGRGGGVLGDLWSYRPSVDTWTPVSAGEASPKAPFAHSAVWDSSNSTMVVYGGFGGETRRDSVWTYAPATGTWVEMPAEGLAPANRGYHTAVWDAAGEQMLVYGGLAGSFEFRGDLWSFQPKTGEWARLGLFGPNPEPRFFHTAAWDPNGRQMLVFGGSANVEGWFLNDLWTYQADLDRWAPVRPTGPIPPARLAHSAVWDPVGAQMLVFFGGCGGCYLDDVWGYKPAANEWVRLNPSGTAPASRGGHSVVWDSRSQQALVYGGGSLNDVWAYRPTSNSWASLAASGAAFPALASHRAVWDDAAERLLVFGGLGGRHEANPVDGLWAYRPTTNAWEQLGRGGPGPTPRQGHTMVWTPAERRAFVFGGTAGDRAFFDDLWAYDAPRDAWARIEGEGPSPTPRAFHTATWDPARGQMLLFGGQGRDGRYLDDLWSYTPTTNRWTLVEGSEPRPSGRIRHSAVWDDATGQMLVFGGYLSEGRYGGNLWGYRPATGTWAELSPDGAGPPSRARHSAVWDPVRKQMLVFGGYVGGIDYLEDFWSYDPNSQLWTLVSARGLLPRARADASAVWNTGAGEVLLFGGAGADRYSEFWSYRPPQPTPAAPRTAPQRSS